jgi:U3 small nucleolar RNA-associated protein 6
LQKLPSSSELWILAAQYEYDANYNISGARNLLLRSLRLNPEKRELWLEYAKLECLYILKIMERRRVLGLDKQEDKAVEDESGFDDQNEITLPTITQEELQKTDGPRLDPLLTSPLTNVSTNPALNGAIPLAVYSSAIASRPDDVSLVAGFYDIFLLFHSGLSFIDSALDTVKRRLTERFAGLGKTLLIQIKDHARGIEVTDKGFPAAIREMMKTANAVPKLSLKERKECCTGLSVYLDDMLKADGLDANLHKVIEIFQGRVGKWKDIMD